MINIFQLGDIEGVVFREILKYPDDRGWLAELYRRDEWVGYPPAMAYISLTEPNTIRGPHEHRQQSDLFYFFDMFVLTLWDNRPESVSYRNKMVVEMTHFVAFVPPGVVHAYQNISSNPAIVINFPDQLYRGENKNQEVDEVRHEDNDQSIFRMQ